MFGSFKECANRLIQKCRIKRKLTFAILGLDDAGKTTTAKGLSGEIDHADTTVTIGFDKDEIRIGKYLITLFDLGGGKKIRDIWKNYLAEVHGIIFVVDASTDDRMEEARQVLGNLLEHPSMTGKPMLLLANKQDHYGALDELDVCEILSLESIVNKNHCPCRVESCSASSGTGKKMDSNIVNGIMWLCDFVDQNFETATDRIEKEMKVLSLLREKEASERRERVRLVREERERQKLENKQDEENEIKENENLLNGNEDPFKRLDADYFSKKNPSTAENSSNLPAVESSASSLRFYSSPTRDSDQLLPINTNQNNSTGFSPSPSKTSVVNVRQDNLLPLRNFEPQQHQRNQPLTDLLPSIENSSQISNNRSPFLKKSFLQPLDTLDGVDQPSKMKKKKKFKKNNVAPITSELETKINSPHDSTQKTKTRLSFVTQPVVGGGSSSKNNTNEQIIRDNDMNDTYSISKKWNRIEELPYIEKLTVDDDDDDIIT